MNWSDRPMGRLVIRAACGLFAGLVLGLLIEPLLFWPNDPDIDPKHFILHVDRIRLPLIGPAISCAMCTFAAAIAGGTEIRGIIKHLVVGALVGVVVGGVIIGGFLFPAIATALTDTTVPTKYYAGYRVTGMFVGIPVGALLGLVSGLGFHFCSCSRG